MTESSRTFLNIKHIKFRAVQNQIEQESRIGQVDRTRIVKKKNRCNDKCRRHLFSMRKIGNGKDGGCFSMEKYGI